MKKIFLSLLTISSFGIYAVFLRGDKTLIYQVPANVVEETKNTTTKSIPVAPSTTVVPKTNKTSVPVVTPVTPPKPSGIYKDGTYVGNSADAYYGYIQVEAVVRNGKLSDVIFLDYPKDRGTSIRINSYAMPILKSEAISAQSAKVDTVSGATDSSMAFRESLAQALSRAKN